MKGSSKDAEEEGRLVKGVLELITQALNTQENRTEGQSLRLRKRMFEII